MTSKTEKQLLNAIDLLVSGTPKNSDGRFTQKNIALEAGTSRATLNRYPNVIREYQRVKAAGAAHAHEIKPFSIEDKNRELQDANTQLKRQLAEVRKSLERQILAARQEIRILVGALQLRDDTIAAKDRQLAELNRKLAEVSNVGTNARFNAIK